ncbi:MAG: radical SAM protein [Myxococcales bacterium]|nr:radical SAM protein [Myxococcales bacterium]
MVQIVEEHGGAPVRDASPHNRRFVISLEDGAAVEAVLYRGDSLCVSSQVGCAVGCPFCASGANGLDRPLHLDELVGQVETVREALADPEGISRITVSGVGEPLHNHEAVAAFVAWCRARSIPASITTSGGPLRRLQEWLDPEGPPHNGVTLSIHAGREETRAKTVPRGPALDPLFAVLGQALPRLSSSRRRKLALAYLLLAGSNDDDDEIDAFLDRAVPLGLKVHLYRYNPVPTSDQAQIDDLRYQTVFEHMRGRGLDVRRSSQARIEDNGGCGTLVALRRTRQRQAPKVPNVVV